MSDSYGKFKKSTLNLSYALHLGLSDKISISFGANTGLSNIKFDDNNIFILELFPIQLDFTENDVFTKNRIFFSFSIFTSAFSKP